MLFKLLFIENLLFITDEEEIKKNKLCKKCRNMLQKINTRFIQKNRNIIAKNVFKTYCASRNTQN